MDTRTLPDAGENVQELDLSYIAGGNVKWDNQSGKSWQFLKNSNPLGGKPAIVPRAFVAEAHLRPHQPLCVNIHHSFMGSNPKLETTLVSSHWWMVKV